jgi:hypothetical protein
MSQYKITSPWAKTSTTNNYLSYFEIRSVPAEADDIRYTIDPQYNYRPDLLSYDMYDTTKLWWVFAQRNMNVIRDPIFDFRVGTTIFIPKKTSLFKMLGL